MDTLSKPILFKLADYYLIPVFFILNINSFLWMLSCFDRINRSLIWEQFNNALMRYEQNQRVDKRVAFFPNSCFPCLKKKTNSDFVFLMAEPVKSYSPCLLKICLYCCYLLWVLKNSKTIHAWNEQLNRKKENIFTKGVKLNNSFGSSEKCLELIPRNLQVGLETSKGNHCSEWNKFWLCFF